MTALGAPRHGNLEGQLEAVPRIKEQPLSESDPTILRVRVDRFLLSLEGFRRERVGASAFCHS
jgi:hypothetical protein